MCVCAFSVNILQFPSRTLLLMSFLQSTPFFYFQPTQSLTIKAKDLLDTVKAQEHASVSEGTFQQPD